MNEKIWFSSQLFSNWSNNLGEICRTLTFYRYALVRMWNSPMILLLFYCHVNRNVGNNIAICVTFEINFPTPNSRPSLAIFIIDFLNKMFKKKFSSTYFQLENFGIACNLLLYSRKIIDEFHIRNKA